MDVRELRCFLQIAKDKSFTKAAGSLFLSQPALSRTMKKLEQDLGVKLFDYRGNTVQLTDCGRILLERAEPLLHEFDAIRDALQEATSLKTGKLRLGITPMIGTLFMAPILIEFCNRWPGVELKLFENGSKVIGQQLLSGELDLGICISGEEQEEGLEAVTLLCDEMMAFVHRENPLAKREAVRFADLREERFNLYNAGSTLNEQILNRCIAAGFLPQINIRSSKAHFLMKMTACGKGICLLPRPYAQQFDMPQLRALSFAEGFPWKCCLVHREKGYLSFAAKAFQTHVVGSFDEIGRVRKEIAGQTQSTVE